MDSAALDAAINAFKEDRFGLPPIENYGLIGDMRTAALVGTSGSIDWLCFPHFDSPSVFAAILDDGNGGRFVIAPIDEEFRSKQLYFPDSNVLVTRSLVDSGVAEVADFMPVGPTAEGYGRRCVVRHVRSIRGTVTLRMRCAPAFDFSRLPHRAEVAQGGVWFRSSLVDLALGCDVPVTIDARAAVADFSLLAPRRHRLRGPLVAQTAVWLHAAGRGEEAKRFADTALHQAFPPEQEAEVRLSIAGMFAISPDVRAEEGRQALALPGLPANLRTRHLALLFHNLVTAGRWEGARAMLDEVTLAVQGCEDVTAQFALELAQSGLMYADGDFPGALEMVETALRTGAGTSDDTRAHLTYQWRCDALTMVDRLDESLQLSTEAVASAQRDRQGWALRIFETGRGRQLLQMGRLADAAAALEGEVPLDPAAQIVSVLDAAGVVALGRAAIHIGDPSLSRQTRDIAQVMLGQSAPSVRRHAAWILALQEIDSRRPRSRPPMALLLRRGGATVHRAALSHGRGRRDPPHPHRTRLPGPRTCNPRGKLGPAPSPAQSPGPIHRGGRSPRQRTNGAQRQGACRCSRAL